MKVFGCFGLLLLPAWLWSEQVLISTIAGGVPPLSPVAGTEAVILDLSGSATDSAGNLYYSTRSCVFKLDRSGVVTRVAGNGKAGYAGDGAPAANAQLGAGIGLAVDNGGNLYIADAGNERIRRVSPAGIITTIAGNGLAGYSGDGRPAVSAKVDYPAGIAVDSAGDLYIADSLNNRIRKVSPAGIITTVAGNGAASDSGDGGPATIAGTPNPNSIAIDAGGTIYFSESTLIRKVTAGVISTLAGTSNVGYSGDGGPANRALINLPRGVTLDVEGNLYFADFWNNRIRKIFPDGTISTVAGSGTAGYSGDWGPATNAQ